MRAPALLALLLLQGAPAHEAPAPGKRAGLGGLAGFHSVSRLEFPDFRLRLTATYVFPDRARWSLEDYDAPFPLADQFFRFGATAHHYATNATSSELTELAREHTLLQLELRRAVMLFPDGFAWEDASDGAREAEVFADSCCRREPLGRLRATTPDGRVSIEARDRAGELRETVTIEERQEVRGRSFPRVLAVSGVNATFRETIERVETRIHYLDLAFTPGDRRKLSGPPRPAGEILASDLVPMTYAERELAAGTSWEHALARARELAEEVRQSLPSEHELDPVPSFEVSTEGLPVRCLVRLKKACEPPPAGFVHQGERLGLLTALGGFSATASSLEHLRAAIPAGIKGGHAYVRVHRPERIDLVLPLLSP